MFFVSGIEWKYLAGIFVIGVVGFAILVAFKPYLFERVKTFLDPSHDPQGSSYQAQQSLIAIGSGGFFGRGFGQSIEKFSYLPEPQGDSIFSVIGEEFGFIGTSLVVLLFVAFALRGLRIANRAPDQFSRLLVIGIVILFITQSFLNIAALIGVFPLTGVPLVFISQGGTSLMFALAGIGIILQVSKNSTAVAKKA
jgi:cell division protein FtsW